MVKRHLLVRPAALAVLALSGWVRADVTTAPNAETVPPAEATVQAPAPKPLASMLAGTPLGRLYDNLADLHQLADGEEVHVADLVARVAPAPALRVPVLSGDVHDLDGLAEIGDRLFP